MGTENSSFVTPAEDKLQKKDKKYKITLKH